MGTTSAFYTVLRTQRGRDNYPRPAGWNLLGGDEDQTELTDLNLVTDLEDLCVTWLAVNVGAIEGSDVDDLELTIVGTELSVAAGDGDVIEEDVCLWVASRGVVG